jgi:tRNA dimethylallyltransferase
LATGKIPVFVIFGATACGKTATALRLFGKDGSSSLSGRGEVVNSDSVQIYKGMVIGSAAPDEFTLSKLPHHGLGFLSPSEEFSVANFVDLADDLCGRIYSQGKFPILLGGTAFYIKHFLFGLPVTPTADPAVRNRLRKECNIHGRETMYQRLLEVDSLAAKRIHPNDEYRILRALEVYEATERPLSSFDISPTLRSRYNFCPIYLVMERSRLYERIESRVEEMVASGLREEIHSLVEQGYNGKSPAMKAIGYKEFFDEEGNLRDDDMEKIALSIKSNTKKYAKRQETFFNSLSPAKRFNPDEFDKLEAYCEEFAKCV